MANVASGQRVADSAPRIVTLLTDFGVSDSYVAEMKAVLLAGAPSATIVDVTHGVPPGDLRTGQYLLTRMWRRFPEGTIHLIVVDPGVGTPRRALAASAHGHFFVAPDNGLLTSLLDSARVVQLTVPDSASATFHGRDVFAPAAARLAAGEALSRLGSEISNAQRTPLPTVREEGEAVVGEVLHIDRFGTLVTNIPREYVTLGSHATVAGGYHAPIHRTFSDVQSGALVAFVGSDGTLEVAARGRSAAQVTGAALGAEVRVTRG